VKSISHDSKNAKWSQTLPKKMTFSSSCKNSSVVDSKLTIPPHVYRITTEIAEYQEKTEDINKMRDFENNNINKDKIVSSKREVMSELNNKLQSTDITARFESSNIEEHSKILQNMKKASGMHRSTSYRRPRVTCTAISEGKIIQLRKPALAKGFNVQKALRDRPQNFHMTVSSSFSKYQHPKLAGFQSIR